MNYLEMKAHYEDVERAHRAAFRKAEWLERRMYEAETVEEFDEWQNRLEQAEKDCQRLGLELIRARYDLTAADLQAI